MHRIARSGLLVLVLATTSLFALEAQAAQQTFVLQDHINRTWTRELVSFPVTFERGACHAQSVRLRGPNGALPCQLTDIAY